MQTRETRRAKENGIWLCQSCGRLIDADAEKFTVELLTGWKRAAQDRAFRELVTPGKPAMTGEAARIGSIIAADNENGADADFEALFGRVHAAAKADVSAYLRTHAWSCSPVELTLSLYNDPTTPPFNISRLPLAVEVEPEVTIIAPPGSGKTTTLLQFATHLLNANSIVPLYFPLGDWSVGSSTLLEALRQRLAFRKISEVDVLRLAGGGRVLLLLDGWNEIESVMRKKLRVELKQIQHNCPSIRIVLTTRQQMLDVPISGPRISIELLSEEQQIAIARAHFGSAGEKIVDEAWRTAGIRELIRIPLYLSALLASGSQGTSPTTKEEVLRLFVQQHECASDHAEALYTMLFGCHAEALKALASHLNVIGSTTMTEVDARRIVTATVAELREKSQIFGQPQPAEVLEVLTSHHTLMRSGTGNRTIAFQHQQFQEWYASHEVADLMHASSNGDIGARVQLRGTVLDQPAWEESILFAVERVSRENDGAGVVAHAIRLALPIDPMLAAEMIYRASPVVWDIIKADILAFVDRWHSLGTVDRAGRFMIMTGRPEFESRIWPLASSEDSQVQLPTLRTAPRFRPSVLGDNLQLRVAALSEATREHLISLIASESSVDGMDLAAELAKSDPSPKVQAEVIRYFQFRRADRHVAVVLADAHDTTWTLLAEQGFEEEIHDPVVVERLRAERLKALAHARDPLERLRLLLNYSSDYPHRDADIASAIADARFPIRDQHVGTSWYYAQERAPAAVLQGLRHRLDAGLELPFHAEEFLSKMDATDDGPIAAAILDVSKDDRQMNVVAVMAGPKTVAALLDKYLVCVQALKTDGYSRSLNDEYQRLQSRVAATRPASFVIALMERANTDDPDLIVSLASLVFRHGNDLKLPIAVDTAIKPQLIDVLRAWTQILISSPSCERYQLNEVSNAIGRFGFRELVPELRRLLDEDLARLNNARKNFMNARKGGDIRVTSDASMRFGNQYRGSFLRLGGDEVAAVAAEYLEDRVFGLDASLILKAISDKQLNLPEPNFHRQWPCFGDVASARAARTAKFNPPPGNAFAIPIFAAIDRLAKPENDREDQILAIQLARVALAMPHSAQDELIARVIDLPQPLAAKRDLFAAIVLDGQALDVDTVMQGVDEWLEDASKNPQHAAHKRRETWEIEPWLELLPYTSRPESLIEGLNKVKDFYGVGWPRRWRRVLAAVATVPGTQGEALLASLAHAHKDIADDYEWMKAILGRNSPDAVLLYVDLLIKGLLGRGPDSVDAWHNGRELAPYVKKFPQLKVELKRRYDAIAAGPVHTVFEYLLGQVGSEDDLIVMVEKYVASGRIYDGRMDAAVRAVTLRQQPVQDGSSSFHIYPAPVGRIRKFLYEMIIGNRPESLLAISCLTAIDVLRDEYGIAANDTRHPDILTERPWPIEAHQSLT